MSASVHPQTHRIQQETPSYETNFTQLHELTREVFNLTLALSSIATNLPSAEARPVLASIHQIDHGIVEFRRHVLLYAEASAMSPSRAESVSWSRDIEEKAQQLEEAARSAIASAIQVGADEDHFERIVDGVRRVRAAAFAMATRGTKRRSVTGALRHLG